MSQGPKRNLTYPVPGCPNSGGKYGSSSCISSSNSSTSVLNLFGFTTKGIALLVLFCDTIAHCAASNMDTMEPSFVRSGGRTPLRILFPRICLKGPRLNATASTIRNRMKREFAQVAQNNTLCAP